MLNKIIQFSVNNKLVIGLFTLALIVAGIFSIKKLPIDALPDITNNQVQIITVAPSQSALDIERLVTFPIEQTVATIPEVEQIRSFSRFGLSVVTLVFKEKANVYWARQQVAERISTAKEQIAAGVGSPELAPITTGLGEIYQYIVRAKKGYEDKYSSMDLRTIQDWMIRRRLLGTPGIADVASFGGYLKQYEIAIDPDKLRSYNLSIADLFAALEKNNQNTGGAYIDKKPTAWFIRSEGLIGTPDDIGKIVVRSTTGGIPVLVRDVATVGYGHAIRYGAMTYNDEGEVTGGLALMLKGENSNTTVENVKKRIAEIQQSLPEGIVIEAFLDRSALVGRAIDTVKRNLLEGALIVIFVLVVFLGNLRAGLVVASVIPLALLFAIIMMNWFGVSGNLMSLGAIDFGLIVDGAVIIVEATMHHLGMRRTNRRLTQPEMDAEVYESASRIRNSAAFGEIIILIVYLPILALTGIEGKMFGPMAQTVSFAILGAFILSLTYVPMMSALVLSKNTQHKRSFSDRMMDFLHRRYSPIIVGALRRKGIIIVSALALFIVSLILFLNMGGEFIPTLDEGDFAVETRLLTGSSLSQTVETVQKAGGILKKEFPDEVKEVVGKIGSSEIPTDPMPVESGDMIVVLKDRSVWTKAGNREELTEKMSQALEDLPGVTFGFQQPIQMRFNELIAGVRQDVAIKIFGEDLTMLARLGKQVGKVVSSVAGAEDLYVEQATGLPQIVVNINREEVAKYGLNIVDINNALSIAFAGQRAGLVYEGEKRFDLVLRLQGAARQEIEDVRNLYITTPDGNQIPLSQLADVQFKVGPNQIQREDTKRRLIVGFNARGRDVGSIVKEVQQKIASGIKMPPGYFVTYGGQFENLKAAQARLSIAVPAALALIFLLLFFAFHSFRQSILIFMAIPLAAIGGVFALLLRGMPFSISAGVGFIALFGVAVLNGIVLINEFNRLQAEGLTELKDIVLKGTQTRLRPVLMTASVASLGFLPMAISGSAGAEVQRPLATVVIGGLITSTLLTLIVLPCLYVWAEKLKTKKMIPNKAALLLLPLLLFLFSSTAQVAQQLSLNQAIQSASANNLSVKTTDLQRQYEQQARLSTGYIGKTGFEALVGQYNSYNWGDNNFSVLQNIPNPANFRSQRALSDALIQSAEYRKTLTVNEVTRSVKQVYYRLMYLQSRYKLLLQQDSIYSEFLKAASLRYKTGEAKQIEQTTAETQLSEVRNQLRQAEADQKGFYYALQQLTGNSTSLLIKDDSLSEKPFTLVTDTAAALRNNPYLAFLRQQVAVSQKERDVIAAQRLPDFNVGYFNQSLIGNPANSAGKIANVANRFQGIRAGVAVSIFNRPLRSRIKAAEVNTQVAESEAAYNQSLLASQWQQATQQYLKNQSSVAYYRSSALPNSDLILRQARIGYREGDTDYAEYLFVVRNAIQLKENYLQSLNELNQSIIQLEYLAGNP